jgi:hypothetical protein
VSTPGMTLKVHGLSNADRLDLPDYVGPGYCSFSEPASTGESYGEPFTVVATVAVTAMALKGLIAYLAHRSADRKETHTEVAVEVHPPGGGSEKRTISVTDRGEGISVELARELGSLTGIPWTKLMP